MNGAADDGWIDKRAAAALVGVSVASVDRWSRLGVLTRRASGRTFVVRFDEVEAMAAERRRWVSIAEAAAMVGCAQSAIKAAVAAGQIQTREGARRRQRALSRASVERFKIDHERATASRRAERERQAYERSLWLSPPTDEPDWVSAGQAAEILGVSYNRVTQLARGDQIAATRIGDRWWFRRLHVEQRARVRELRRGLRRERGGAAG